MNSCLAVVVMTIQIFLGDGQEHTFTITGCVDYETIAATTPQQQPGGALVIGGNYESMVDLGLPVSDDPLLRYYPDVGRSEMGVTYE